MRVSGGCVSRCRFLEGCAAESTWVQGDLCRLSFSVRPTTIFWIRRGCVRSRSSFLLPRDVDVAALGKGGAGKRDGACF